MTHIFRKSSEVITIINGYLRLLGNSNHLHGIYVLIKNYCISPGIGLHIGDRGQITNRTPVYKHTLPFHNSTPDKTSGDFVVCCESAFFVGHDPCVYICVRLLDKAFGIPELIRYKSTSLCTTDEKTDEYDSDDNTVDEQKIIIQYVNISDQISNDMYINDNDYIDEYGGYITADYCPGFKDLNCIGLINQEYVKNIAGFFQRRNQFTLVSNKIYKVLNLSFIYVESTLLTGIYDDKVDLRLVNKRVYIPLKDTNLWRINTKFINFCNKIIGANKANKFNLYCHSKKGTIFGDAVSICINSDYQEFTNNDEVYLLTPEYKHINNEDGICIYLPKCDSIGWIRWNECPVKLYNDSKTIESHSIEYILIQDGNNIYLYGNIDPNTICYCIIVWETNNNENTTEIIQLIGSSARLITLKKSNNLSQAFGWYYWCTLS